MRKNKLFICTHCNVEFSSREKERKFCSLSCAATYSNLNRVLSLTTKLNIQKSMKKYWESHEKERIEIFQGSQKGKNNIPKNIFDLSKRTISKIIKRLDLKCSRCGWDEGVCDIHHINPKNNGGTDDHTNLTYICPNCHRLAHMGKILSNELITLDIYIGDKWKDFYYG